jgi:ArsR family transcriptional regulator
MRALSDEIRLRIINILYYSDLYVCEIVDILKLPQSTVSRHLNIIKTANMIIDEKEGSWIKYSLIKNKSYDNIVKELIENKLIDDKKCIEDLENLKYRIKDSRGCKNNCRKV